MSEFAPFRANGAAAVDVTPVPPFATANVPATVITPDVAVDGVSPVDPNEILVTGEEPLVCASRVTTPELFS
jgi:hypothetical protein